MSEDRDELMKMHKELYEGGVTKEVLLDLIEFLIKKVEDEIMNIEYSEAQISKEVQQWLVRKRIFYYRNAAGGGRKARFGKRGMPDIVCVIAGQYVGIELKDVSGEQSRVQKEFEVELVKAGGRYILARSLEDVERELR
jgi:hypothetical protein